MNQFEFSLPDEVINMKKISDLEDDLSMETEDIKVTLPDEEHSRIIWGNKDKVTMCNGMTDKSKLPPLVVHRGKSGVIHIHLFGTRTDPCYGAKLYQLLGMLEENDVVHMYIHDIVWNDTIMIQSAITNCKATIHTFIYMVEATPIDSCAFFIWMMGTVLQPIPYDIISLVEPITIFNQSSGTAESRRNYLQFDTTIKQQWYDHAMGLGLITMEEVTQLNEGKAVLITNINARIEESSKRKTI